MTAATGLYHCPRRALASFTDTGAPLTESHATMLAIVRSFSCVATVTKRHGRRAGANAREGIVSTSWEESEKRNETLVWGIVLIALGIVFLLAMSGWLPFDFMHTWWALFPVGLGLTKLVTARTPHGIGSGVTTLGIGIWLLISSNGWYGLGWSRSWPLTFVAIGLGILARSLAASLMRQPEEGDHVR